MALPKFSNVASSDQQTEPADNPTTPATKPTYMKVAKSSSKRNKKHRKKLKKVSQSQSNDSNLTSRTPTADPKNVNAPPKSDQGCQGNIPTSAALPTIDEKAGEDRIDDCNFATHKGTQDDHPNESGCSNCEELKNSLLILQDSFIELKEEMIHQRATTDLVLSTPDTSDKKISTLIKGRVSPLETAITQMRNDLNLLRAAVDEQNKMLDTLINTKNQDDASLQSIQSIHKHNKSRIETLEIGQENLKLAIRSVARSHVGQQPAQPINQASAEPISQPPTSIQPAGIDKNKNSWTSTTSSQQSHQPPPTSWAEVVAKDDVKPFTKVSKNNAKSHQETSAIAPPGTSKDNNLAGNRPQTRGHDDKRKSRSPAHQHSTQSTSGTAANPKPASPSSRPKYSRGSNGEFLYRRYTALLIHDQHFEDFNPYRFNHQFNVHKLQANSYGNLMNKTKQLNNTLKRLKPDCIYIHTGINDVLKKKAGVINYIEELTDHLLKSTEAQICFSLLIPSTNDSDLNEKIHTINTEIVDYISWLHQSEPSTKERIFSFTNNPLEDYNFYSATTGFKLRERGQKLLWLRLREGLRKTMRLPRINHQSGNANRSRRITNRFSDD